MNSTIRAALLGAALPGLLLAAPTHAQVSTTTTTTHTKSTGPVTPLFAKKAAIGGIAEVSIGQIGVDKAQNADVKSFAQQMVTDHTAANDELKALAATKGWTLPSDTDAKHKSTAARLQTASGAAFDRRFMNAMVADHNAALAMFRQYARSGADADLKAWAAKTLPTLEHHQQMAKTTAQKLASTAAR